MKFKEFTNKKQVIWKEDQFFEYIIEAELENEELHLSFITKAKNSTFGNGNSLSLKSEQFLGLRELLSKIQVLPAGVVDPAERKRILKLIEEGKDDD